MLRKNYWAVKHDKSYTRIYHIWTGIKGRCLNKNYCQYKYYGGREIKVCDEWMDKVNGFMNFYNWSMLNGYTDELSIDRLNPDGDYAPSNCRWATRHQQNMNLRNTQNTSGYIGISKHSSGTCWYGRVKVYKKAIYTGMSKNIHEAALMRNKYIIENNLDNKLNKVHAYA